MSSMRSEAMSHARSPQNRATVTMAASLSERAQPSPRIYDCRRLSSSSVRQSKGFLACITVGTMGSTRA